MKKKSLENQIKEIMQHYHFDPYNKNRYIENCTQAIVKLFKQEIDCIIDKEK